MKRRQWLLSLPTALVLAAASVHAQPSYTVTSAQLQQAVAEKFPMRYPVGGLLELTLQPPRLRLLPEQNRLGTVMVVDAAGPALSRSGTGNFDVDFALRYEASDQSIRAHKLKVNTLSLSGLPPGPAALLQAYGPSLAEQSLLEVVLHKLQPKDLMLADGLGMEPGAITVTARGLVIGFVPKKTL
ncbi:MAG: DUF1439 domain-containing protein [Polaromonas sp.]|uniref:DUF1439 domain-containing protein n=1 Tax=Polaromonas sp. TaxID=1869339 RepID=UPI002735BAAA|nr:DUF1439 domain-containing protein [Polaromonas sp.]MDP2819272.1 DUF1439 domain-containing protein [Polaromonas sp.]